MNLAFPALLVLLLVLPGSIFRYTYARGTWGWSSPTSFRSISDELAYSVVLAVGLHCLAIVGVGLLGFRVDFASVVALLIGDFGPSGKQYGRAIESVAMYPGRIALYFLGISFGASAAGHIAHKVVRALRLDHRTRIFRFRNEWFYLLSGEVMQFAESADDIREIAGVYLSAVVDHSKESYLYRGIVADWSFDPQGQLDAITLRMAHRRPLSKDREKPDARIPGELFDGDDRYYDIHGDRFVLRYSQIRTLNLDYFSLAESGEETEAPGTQQR